MCERFLRWIFHPFRHYKNCKRSKRELGLFFISISVINWIIEGDFIFDIVNSNVHNLWLYNITDRIYKYNPDVSYKPNGGTYLQIISAKDLYIQNITVAENDGHSDSFQIKFPNVFTNYPLGAVRSKVQRLGSL